MAKGGNAVGAGEYAEKLRKTFLRKDILLFVGACVLCVVLAFILFGVDPLLNPERAIRIVRESSNLRPGMTNEEFVRSTLTSTGAILSVGWGADLMENGSYLVYFLFLDARALLRGWFFELVPGRRAIHEVKRSHGGAYADAIDAAFAAARIPLPEERLLALRVQRSEAFGRGKTVQDVVNERLQAEGARSSYGWIVVSMPDGRRIVGFLYEPAVPNPSPMRGFVFEVAADGSIKRIPFDPERRYESALLLHEANGTPVPERLRRESPIFGEGSGPTRIDAFLKETLRYYGPGESDLTARLGPPSSSRTKRTGESGTGEFAPIVASLAYRGLQADFFRWPDREILAYLDITSAEYPLGGSIRVGMHSGSVRAELGEPQRMEDNVMIYTGAGCDYELFFRLDGRGVIRSMEIVLYAD
jgi:hypothetical protein